MRDAVTHQSSCFIFWPEHERHRREQTREGRDVVSAEFFAGIKNREHHKNCERDELFDERARLILEFQIAIPSKRHENI